MLLHKVIDRVYLAEFTWTGKSVGGRGKNAFRDLDKTNDFLYDVINTIDEGYTKKSYLDDLKNKIIKYAYE